LFLRYIGHYIMERVEKIVATLRAEGAKPAEWWQEIYKEKVGNIVAKAYNLPATDSVYDVLEILIRTGKSPTPEQIPEKPNFNKDLFLLNLPTLIGVEAENPHLAKKATSSKKGKARKSKKTKKEVAAFESESEESDTDDSDSDYEDDELPDLTFDKVSIFPSLSTKKSVSPEARTKELRSLQRIVQALIHDPEIEEIKNRWKISKFVQNDIERDEYLFLVETAKLLAAQFICEITQWDKNAVLLYILRQVEARIMAIKIKNTMDGGWKMAMHLKKHFRASDQLEEEMEVFIKKAEKKGKKEGKKSKAFGRKYGRGRGRGKGRGSYYKRKRGH